MKALKLALLASVLAVVASPAIAQTTTIKFPKGSYCGSFSGDVKGRTFSLNLRAGQTLTVDTDGYNVKDIIVKQPNGKILKEPGQDYGVWNVRRNGKHSVTIKTHPNENHLDAKFCAYSGI